MNHDLTHATGDEVRRHCRAGRLRGPTAGLALGYVQANLVILPGSMAGDFLDFCRQNPRPCPLLEALEPGSPHPRRVARDADVRTDLPRYCIYQHGELTAQPADVVSWWCDDLAAFLLGCSFTFEYAMLRAGLPVRHVELNCNVPMYRTTIPCTPAGPFGGNMVVSMRPMTPAQAAAAARICRKFPLAHGEPVHIGEPAAIGIRRLETPDYGDPVPIHPGETPVFWACGVTPQNVLANARPPLAVTHFPGHMFVTDLRDEDLAGRQTLP